MTVTAVELGGSAALPLLVLGPSPGTSAVALWGEAARHLTEEFRVVACDLPGHETSRTSAASADDLARGVLEVVDGLGGEGSEFHYAGVAAGGEVGLRLMRDAPERVLSATLLDTRAPETVARLVRRQAHAAERDRRTVAQVRAEGMAVRRAVLGEEHVDRATAASTALTADFQRFITEYAWGGVWTRDGLDRRTRSLVTLTALVAGGHHDELAMHVRAARGNGVTVREIEEVILQCAIYCGVPAANTAFRIAQGVLVDLGDL